DRAPDWETTTVLGGDTATPVSVNTYFRTHPDQVIGDLGIRTGQYGPELDVRYAGDVAEALYTRLADSVAGFTGGGPLFTRPTEPAPEPAPTAPAASREGHLAATSDGRFTVVVDGQLEPHQVPASQAPELRALLGLRDTVVALLGAEAATAEDTAELDELRHRLGTRYDGYVTRYGPLNRVTVRRTGRVDPDTGEERTARIRPPQGRFRDDPHSPAVYALEHYDAATGTATKADIFRERVITPRAPRLGADSPADAVAICLDTHGEVRLPEIARLLGTDPQQARDALADLVFDDPDRPGRLIPAPEYLSGNVRRKLAAAEAAALHDSDGRWDPNIAALSAAVPVDLSAGEIDGRLGASWLSADVVAQFLTELLDDPSVRVEHPGGAVWAVKGTRHTVLAATTWGTGRVSAIDLAHAALEQRVVKVFDELDDGRRILNLTETVVAQEKLRELGERFADWIWSDPDRAHRLARTYNDMFNAIVLRSYDGTDRQLPGLARTFTPREHQRAAVARIVSEPAVLLAHDVGAGKTAEMVIGAMELRRLGMATKPAVVVPNHMLEQFSREWMQLYPQARILAANTEDLTRDRRRLFVARVATGDWDAVILSRSAFERLPLSPAAQQAYLDRELDVLRTQLERSRAGAGLTVKRLEGALQRAEERIKKLTDSVRDPGITFEQTGIDYLFVDEAHGYKNLRLVSNIPGVGIEGSQRASDLDMKIAHLQERHGARVVTFATATPIANSVAEAYVMQRYLRPDILDAAGLVDFDTWAATFGEVTTDLELSPDGSRYRMQSRFAKFRNVPELLRIWHLSADIKTGEDLQLPTPDLSGGRAQTVVVPPGDELTTFMAELAERADRVHAKAVDPAEDNMLRIATHGRMAALDLRLLQRDPGDAAKLAAAADRIADLHHRHADQRYRGHRAPGALQLVFCDLGTPREDGRWSVYDELRALLVARGVPPATVRFVHEARNDRAKGELFAACRTGQVAVLIGSTERMGIGTNVQTRAIALHHLDCPWRPADLAQREGRILRQGNLNPQVQILRYVTEGSFDAYLWQTVERKARFIHQVMRGRLDVREIEDIGDTALSYSEVKALATGDPRVLDKARADADTARLDRLHRAWQRNRLTLRSTLTHADEQLPRLHADLARLHTALAGAVETRGDAFALTVAGHRHTSRHDAAVALGRSLVPLRPAYTDLSPRVVGSIGG
ncbi:MAG: putative Helicase, partial [Mycobacterium sp.]|nr:putative Helicase [Mycobacterium sp.]